MLKVTNPLTASQINLNPMSIISYIMWVVLAFFIVGIGQKVKDMVQAKAPFLDGTIEPLTRQPSLAAVQQTTFL